MKRLYFLVVLFLNLGSVKAQNINFTSSVFKTKLLAASPSNQIAKNLSGASFKIDSNGDGEIQFTEALQVSALNLNGFNVLDLDGIQYFTALKVLECKYNMLTSLNLINNLALESLNCGGNSFLTLTVSNLPNLNNLVVAPNNLMTELYVNNLPSLTEFKLFASSWDVIPNLVTLDCSNNALTSLKLYYSIDGHDNIRNINCSHNALNALDIREVSLHHLDVSNNQLTALQKYYNSLGGIKSLNISNNNFVEFTIGSSELSDFQFSNNPLESLLIENFKVNESLEVTNLPTLNSLKLMNFNLNELTISNLPLLNKIDIQTEVVYPILISNLPLLKDIYISSSTSEFEFSNFNNFTTIFKTYDYYADEKFDVTCRKLTLKDITSLTNVETGFVVEELVIQNLPNLTSLSVDVSTEQTSLQLSNLPLMNALTVGSLDNWYANTNCLDLNLDGFPSLTHLNIGYVKINSLTLGNLPNLSHLSYSGGECYNTTNQLQFNNLPALVDLKVMDPLLDNLTIIDLPNLYNLTVKSNELENLVLNNLPQLHEFDCAIKWYQGGIPPLPVLNLSNLPNLYSVNIEGVTSSLILQNLPLLHSFIFNYDYGLSIYDLYPIDYIFNNLPSLFHLELNKIQTDNLVMTNLPSLNTLQMYEAVIGNSFTFQNIPVETIALDYVKLQNITFSNLPNIKNVSLINFYSYLQSITFSNIPTLETFKLQGNGIDNNLGSLDFSGFQNLKSIIVKYSLSNLILNNLPSLNYLNTSGNKFPTLNLVSLPSLEEFVHNGNSWQNLTINLKNLPSLSKVDVSFNQEYLNSLDLSECPNLSELHFVKYIDPVEYDTPIDYLNLRNGNPNLQILDSNAVDSICVDDDDEKELLQNLNPNLEETIFTSYCDLNPAGTFFLFQGNNIFDFNNNGCDTNDLYMSNIKYTIVSQDGINNLIANQSGSYSIPVQEGTNTITPVLENPTFFNILPTSASVTFPETTSPFTQNFCITPNGIHQDVDVNIIPVNAAIPGFDANYKIIFRNLGNVSITMGTIGLNYNDEVLDFVSASPNSEILPVGTLFWTFENLKPFETRTINVSFNLNSPMETPALNGDDVLVFEASSNISMGFDENPADNVMNLQQTVVNSFDPNDKTCLEGTFITPDMIGKYVHYMIRFENTGTFAAQNIVVKDMIDAAKFDVSSLIALNGSHSYITRIKGNKVEFIFENINLSFDDANNDGYVVFKIKTLPTLALGDSFSNSASIYFDYNFPIVTNPAVTTFAVLGTEDFVFSNYITLYPNPTNNALNITVKQAIELQSISIYNTLGQMMVSIPNAKGISSVDVSNLSTGNYFIKIVSDKGTSNAKFIKQ